jgi:hypothetical protein
MMKFTSLFFVVGILVPPVMSAAADQSSPASPQPADHQQVQDTTNKGTTDGGLADPATQLVNARMGFAREFTRDKLDVGLFVNNVFDSHPELAKYGQALLSAPTFSTFRPRTIGRSANVSF